MNKKTKAFTLTELLVVVVVIGVLSAVVLPKFSKVIETRRTTEAEELMGAIRTEQEKRCALDKNYLTNLSDMTDIVKSAKTKNYDLTLASTGVKASRKDKYNYTLSIPSYADGRICCEGADCDKLNKNYPKCGEFTPEASPEACAGEVEETPEPSAPPAYECTGNATEACGCQSKGTRSRTCNTATGVWSDWGVCSISDSCECTGTKPDGSKKCNTCGTQTRSVTCDSATGEWNTGSWSACNKTKAECLSPDEPIEIDSCLLITSANWSECCAGKYTNKSCYQVCEKERTPSHSGSGDGELASDPDMCNDLDLSQWVQDDRCSGVNAEASISACRGYRVCNGFTYRPKTTLPGEGSGSATLTPSHGSEGDKFVGTVIERYYCSVYSECSESCPGYHSGLISSETVVP